MSRETVFCQKVVTAFPIPFRILVRVVPKYRKGQIHARIRINFPARELAKRTLPMLSPNQTVLDGILQRPGNLSLASGGLCLRDCGQQHHGDRVGDGRGKKHQRERHSGKHAVDAER